MPNLVSQVFFEVLDFATLLSMMQKYQKTISIPERYRYGFLEILLKNHVQQVFSHMYLSQMYKP